MDDFHHFNTEDNYDHKKSYVFAMGAGFFFGVSGIILLNQAQSIGFISLFPQCIATTTVFMVFHLFQWLKAYKERKLSLKAYMSP